MYNVLLNWAASLDEKAILAITYAAIIIPALLICRPFLDCDSE